jgi:hypothetical protein
MRLCIHCVCRDPKTLRAVRVLKDEASQHASSREEMEQHVFQRLSSLIWTFRSSTSVKLDLTAPDSNTQHTQHTQHTQQQQNGGFQSAAAALEDINRAKQGTHNDQESEKMRKDRYACICECMCMGVCVHLHERMCTCVWV